MTWQSHVRRWSLCLSTVAVGLAAFGGGAIAERADRPGETSHLPSGVGPGSGHQDPVNRSRRSTSRPEQPTMRPVTSMPNSRPAATAAGSVEPPAGAPPLTPVPDAFDVRRDDLPWRDSVPSPLEGVWRLRLVVRPDGQRVSRPLADGWLSFGQRHLFVHLQLVGVMRGGAPALGPGSFLQSGVYRWEALANGVLTTTLLVGHRSAGRSDRVQLDGAGLVERRTLTILGSTLRIARGATDYLEFVRVE